MGKVIHIRFLELNLFIYNVLIFRKNTLQNYFDKNRIILYLFILTYLLTEILSSLFIIIIYMILMDPSSILLEKSISSINMF